MADITIKINMDNAAFNHSRELEAARILENIAYKLKDVTLSAGEVPLKDWNGNTCGLVTVTE